MSKIILFKEENRIGESVPFAFCEAVSSWKTFWCRLPSCSHSRAGNDQRNDGPLIWVAFCCLWARKPNTRRCDAESVAEERNGWPDSYSDLRVNKQEQTADSLQGPGRPIALAQISDWISVWRSLPVWLKGQEMNRGPFQWITTGQ